MVDSPSTTDASLPTISGDINAGFAFFLDCVVNLFVLSGVLLGVFNFPVEIVFGKIIPGSIVGILAGNLAFVYYARQVAKKTGHMGVTAIPLGLDLPTVFGMCFFVLGPVFLSQKEALGVDLAAETAWHVGMASAFWMASVKLLFSFVGRTMMRNLPPFALIGTMAGIATVWLGAEAIIGVFELPEVGMIALMIMAVSLIAGHKLPGNMPGAVLAIVVGTAVFYLFALTGAADGYTLPKLPALQAALPLPTFAGFGEIFGLALAYIGIILPFAFLIATSSVNVVAGAKVVGDEYDASHVVRLDAMSTAISALFGGVVQTTPYFGHPTYKRMGAGTRYSIGVALVIAVGGFAGIIALASVVIPSAVLKPILIVVACDIMRLCFQSGNVRHAPALLFALIPAIIYYTSTKMGALYDVIAAKAPELITADMASQYMLLGALSRGYILTSLIWGVLLIWILDRQFIKAAGASVVAAVLTAFGVIHSVLPTSGMYLPWDVPTGDMIASDLVMRLVLAYVFAAATLFAFEFSVSRDTASAPDSQS